MKRRCGASRWARASLPDAHVDAGGGRGASADEGQRNGGGERERAGQLERRRFMWSPKKMGPVRGPQGSGKGAGLPTEADAGAGRGFVAR